MEKDLYDGFPITKLPPGKAYGADDLHKWALSRAMGRSGGGRDKSKAVILECRECHRTRNIIVDIYKRKVGERCECGAKMYPRGFKRKRKRQVQGGGSYKPSESHVLLSASRGPRGGERPPWE